MKKITYEDLNTRIPNVIYADNGNYLDLYLTYQILLTDYLAHTLGLKEFENQLKNSNLKYKKVDEENMDIYQYLSNLDYFYVRNNLYLEHLSEEEKRFLQSKINNDNLDEQSTIFIQNTMSKVLDENYGKDPKPVVFGPLDSNYMALSNELVIGFRYDKYNLQGMSDDEWNDNFEKQEDDLEIKLDDLRKNISQFSIMPVKIIEYNDYNIKKKETNTKVR